MENVISKAENEEQTTTYTCEIDTSVQLFPLSEDEESTSQHILHCLKTNAKMTILPTHNVNEMGQFSGFKLVASSQCHVSNAPFNEEMFCGLAACMCQTSDNDVARILGNRDEYKAKLLDLINSIDDTLANGSKPASFSCIPSEVNGISMTNNTVTHIKSTWRKGVDSEQWALEKPKMLGVYHGYIRLPSGEKQAKLFVVCDGGCNTACVEYYNMMLDLGKTATLSEAARCEETWWLRKACSRARNRLLYLACEALSLVPQQSITDVHSHDPVKIAAPICETLRYDFFQTNDDHVTFLNCCVDTTRIQNGILCKMHNTEGLWVFKGAPRSNSNSFFGGMFGRKDHLSVFPMQTNEITNKKMPKISSMVDGKLKHFLHFNNDFLQNLTKTGWDRDYGIVELVPVVDIHT